MADELEEMFSEPLGEVSEQPEAPAPEPVEIPQEPEPQAPEPQPEPIVEPEPKPDHTVPLAKYLDTRDELKEVRRRIAEFEAQQQQQRQAPAMPDPYDDPAGYNAYMKQELQSALQAQKVDMSWQFAVQQHGQETTEAAKNWALEKAQTDPAFHAALDTAFQNQPMPIDWIVRQHKQDSLVQQIGSDPDEWVRRRAAELGLIAPVAAAVLPVATHQQAVPPARVPPRSLATQGSGPSDIRDVAVGPLAAVDAVFPQ